MKRFSIQLLLLISFTILYSTNILAGFTVQIWKNGAWVPVVVGIPGDGIDCDKWHPKSGLYWQNCVTFLIAPGSGGHVLDDAPSGSIVTNSDNTSINFKNKTTGIETFVIDLNTVPVDQVVSVTLNATNDGAVITYYDISEVVDPGNSGKRPLALRETPDENSEYAVYPNPASNEISVSGSFNALDVYLIDLNGRKLMIDFTEEENGILLLHVETIERGSYILQIVSEKSVLSKPILLN